MKHNHLLVAVVLLAGSVLGGCEAELKPGERRFRLLTHCGLSFPLEFEDRLWLPVDERLRNTMNPPEGFSSDNYHDMGSIRKVDEDTVVYTSSGGTEVEYRPTERKRGGCA